jgi:Uma2 family endonuclease
MADTARVMEVRAPATYQDVIDAPEHKVAEILDGTLYLSPRPPIRAGVAKQELLLHLWRPYDRGEGGPGGWWLMREPELHFGSDVLVPDLVGWRRSRLPKLPEGPGVTLAPDWVCEALAPETRAFDITGKRLAYARAGIPHLWQIDHEARILEAFALRDGFWRLGAALKDDEEVSLAPFEGIAFPLSDLFPD